MKRYMNILGTAWLAALLLTACTPDKYDSVEASGLPVAANYADHISITIDPEERYAYLHFSSAVGVTPVWLIDGTTYSSEFTVKKFYDHAGTHNVELRVKNANGISADAVSRSFDMVIAEPKWVPIDGDGNLWNAANKSYGWRYLDDDMSTSRPNPVVTEGERSYTFTLPEATSYRDQCMMTFGNTNLTVEDENQEYDFIAVIESSVAFTAGVKLYDRTDANNYLFDENVDLKVGTTRFFVRQVTAMSPIAGGSGRNAKRLALRFYFGTNPDNTDITIRDIIFQKHQ